MKKRVFLALLAAAAVTFVGCSKDDDGPDEGPQTYTITFEGDDWSPLVVANYNGGKAMSVVYEDKAYTWTDHRGRSPRYSRGAQPRPRPAL